jgi:hypothetical protein
MTSIDEVNLKYYHRNKNLNMTGIVNLDGDGKIQNLL